MTLARRASALLLSAACLGSALGCTSSPSYGTPQDCAAAGGQCILGSGGNLCAKQGPENTCNCNPMCSTGGLLRRLHRWWRCGGSLSPPTPGRNPLAEAIDPRGIGPRTFQKKRAPMSSAARRNPETETPHDPDTGEVCDDGPRPRRRVLTDAERLERDCFVAERSRLRRRAGCAPSAQPRVRDGGRSARYVAPTGEDGRRGYGPLGR